MRCLVGLKSVSGIWLLVININNNACQHHYIIVCVYCRFSAATLTPPCAWGDRCRGKPHHRRTTGGPSLLMGCPRHCSLYIWPLGTESTWNSCRWWSGILPLRVVGCRLRSSASRNCLRKCRSATGLCGPQSSNLHLQQLPPHLQHRHLHLHPLPYLQRQLRHLPPTSSWTHRWAPSRVSKPRYSCSSCCRAQLHALSRPPPLC